MVLLTDFPEEIFPLICKHLEFVQDIFNFEASHPLIERKITYSFWGHPNTLILSNNDSDNAIFNRPKISTPTGQCFVLPANDASIISDVIFKMRNLQHLYLGPMKRKDVMRRILYVLLESSLKLQKIFILMKNPENTLQDSPSVNKEIWPSNSKLVNLINKQKETLNYLGLIFGTNECVSISRPQKRNSLSIEYFYTGSIDARFRIIPFLFNFSNANIIPIHLEINIKAQSDVAHCVLAHCIPCIPSRHRRYIRQIKLRMHESNLSSDFRSIFSLGGTIGNFKMLEFISFYFENYGKLDDERLEEIFTTVSPQLYDITFTTSTYQRRIEKSVLTSCRIFCPTLVYCA